VDLDQAPPSYRKRVIEFRNLLRNESTRAAKVKKALELASKRSSPYRLDAINFLADVRANESVPVLIKLSNDPDVQEFAIFALGRVGTAEVLPTLIKHLKSENENVRGNSERGLKAITGIGFEFQYADPPAKRAQDLKEIERWWEMGGGKTFKPPVPSAVQAQEAEGAWQLYGIEYLNDLTR